MCNSRKVCLLRPFDILHSKQSHEQVTKLLKGKWFTVYGDLEVANYANEYGCAQSEQFTKSRIDQRMCVCDKC